jgi:hypothetical protein
MAGYPFSLPAAGHFLGPEYSLVSQAGAARPDRARDAISLLEAAIDAVGVKLLRFGESTGLLVRWLRHRELSFRLNSNLAHLTTKVTMLTDQ